MPEPTDQTAIGRTRARTDALEKQVAELQRTVIALVEAIQNAEDEVGENLMPEGTYFGHEFKD
jgi:hypothetical protein